MRITLLIVAGFLAIAGGGFFFLMWTISDDVERQYSQAAEEPLVDFAHILASLIEQDIEEGQLDVALFRKGMTSAYERDFFAKIYRIEKSELFTHVYVTDSEGIVVFDSQNGLREGEDYSQYNDVYLVRQGKYGMRATRTDLSDSRTSVFYIAAPIRSNGELIGTLTVSRPETATASFAEESRELVYRWSIITAAVVLLLSTIWAYWILHPIRDLRKHARLIADGKQSSMPVTGLAELRSLSRALEDMRRELEGKHYVENYVQALTHELKSPLAAIRGAAELIDETMPEEKRRRFLDNILTETTRSEDMVRRLVQLAAVESRTNIERLESFDLAGLVREEVAAFSSVIETRQLKVDADGLSAGAKIEGDPLMLRIAMRNVLNNAFDFSPEGGRIEISIVTGSEGIELCVRDEGPGMPDYAVGRVFDRFYSLKNETTGRKGSGIGLSFVRATMELHGGCAELRNRDGQGGGAEMILRFVHR